MVRNSSFVISSVLILGFFSHAYAQPQIDSLNEEVQQASGAEQAKLLLELAEKVWRSDPSAGIKHAEEALVIARRMDDYDLQARALEKRAVVFSVQHDYAKALEDYLRALEISRSTGSEIGEARTLHNMGNLFQSQGNHGKALNYYYQSLRIKEELQDTISIAHTLLNIGIVYEDRDEDESAIEFYRRALFLSEEADDATEIAITATQAGKALKETGRSEEALAMFQRALNAMDELNSNHAKATILLDMSSVFQNQKAYEGAIRVNLQEVEAAKEAGSVFLEAQGLENLGGIYGEMGNSGEALKNLEAARAIFDTLNMGDGSARIRIKLARIYLNNTNPDDAVDAGLEALNLATKSRALDHQRDILHLLADAYVEQGNFREAFHIQNKLLAVIDSTFSKDQERQISEMRTRYETEQKEQEITLLQKEKEQEFWLRNAFAAGLVLIVIIGFLIYNRQRLKIKKNEADLENIRLKEEKLKQDVEFKNRQLTTHTLNLVQKNEVMKELKKNISDIKKKAKDGDVTRQLGGVEHLVDYSFNLDEDWEEFRLYFEEVHTGFFDALNDQYPALTPNELRLSAMVKLNLTSKQIATIMGISPDSVKTARYRLRKKLDMDTEENLTEFMMNIEKEQAM